MQMMELEIRSVDINEYLWIWWSSQWSNGGGENNNNKNVGEEGELCSRLL